MRRSALCSLVLGRLGTESLGRLAGLTRAGRPVRQAIPAKGLAGPDECRCRHLVHRPAVCVHLDGPPAIAVASYVTCPRRLEGDGYRLFPVMHLEGYVGYDFAFLRNIKAVVEGKVE